MAGGTTLRLPYSLSVSNKGALGLSIINEGELSNAIVNTGSLQLSIYNPKTDDTLQAGNGKMTTITVYEGDYGYDLQFTITDVDGDAFNLTGATVKFKMALPNSTTLKIDGECDIVVAGSGTCAYTTSSEDFDTSGTYDAELEITYTSPAKIYTIQGITVNVVSDLPRGS